MVTGVSPHWEKASHSCVLPPLLCLGTFLQPQPSPKTCLPPGAKSPATGGPGWRCRFCGCDAGCVLRQVWEIPVLGTCCAWREQDQGFIPARGCSVQLPWKAPWHHPCSRETSQVGFGVFQPFYCPKCSRPAQPEVFGWLEGNIHPVSEMQ